MKINKDLGFHWIQLSCIHLYAIFNSIVFNSYRKSGKMLYDPKPHHTDTGYIGVYIYKIESLGIGIYCCCWIIDCMNYARCDAEAYPLSVGLRPPTFHLDREGT